MKTSFGFDNIFVEKLLKFLKKQALIKNCSKNISF